MSTTSSPNMSLPVPSVGSESGPQYANDINSALSLIDSHDHSSGKGVQVTPAGLNINAALTFANNFATNMAGISFFTQASTPSTAATLYVALGVESGTPPDLWYNDGTNPAFQITSGGGLAAVATTVAGMSYAGGTFTFTQGAGSTTPAILDAGNIIIRPITAGTAYGINLKPPSGLAAQYDVLLPAKPASATSIVQMSTAGVLTAGLAVDNVTLNNSGTVLSVKNGGISTTQISSTAGITGSQLAATTVDVSNMASIANHKATGSSYSNNTTSFTTIVSQSLTISTVYSSTRPFLFSFSGSSINLADNTAQGGIVTLQLLNTTANTVAATWTIALSDRSSLISSEFYPWPASSFNYSGVLSAGGNATCTYALQAKVNQGGLTVSSTGTIMTIIQV